MLRFRNLIHVSVFTGIAAYGYAQTDSVYLLLTAAWFAGFVAWNLFEFLLQTFSNGTGPIERNVATHHVSIPVVGLVIGVFSVVANSTVESHWFMLAHGIFWIVFGIFLLIFMFFSGGRCKRNSVNRPRDTVSEILTPLLRRHWRSDPKCL